MKKILFAGVFVFMFFVQPIFSLASNGSEVMEELSVYVTNKSGQHVYVEYYVGQDYNSADSKGSLSVPAGSVNLLANEGVTCYAEVGDAGISKNQRNVITVNVYDNASIERKLLRTQAAKDYMYYNKDITRDKGNYWMIYILTDYEVTVEKVMLFTGREDMDSNLGRAVMHYQRIRLSSIAGAVLLGLVSLFLFLKSIKNGMMIGSRISKLGLLFLVINSLIVITFCIIDTVDAIETSSSGFALIPILMIDTPAMFIAMPIMGFISKFALSLVPLSDNVLYVIIQKGIFAISFLIFGGLQWYVIGWLISILKQRFLNRLKAKE